MAACAVSLLLTSVGPTHALGATASWEFDRPTCDYGPVTPGSGPTEPHEFILTSTGETEVGVAAYGIDRVRVVGGSSRLSSAGWHWRIEGRR